MSLLALAEDKIRTADKMEKLERLSDAIQRARENVAERKTPEAALELQHLIKQRESLKATLPQLRIVT